LDALVTECKQASTSSSSSSSSSFATQVMPLELVEPDAVTQALSVLVHHCDEMGKLAVSRQARFIQEV